LDALAYRNCLTQIRILWVAIERYLREGATHCLNGARTWPKEGFVCADTRRERAPTLALDGFWRDERRGGW
jgi:hypothetical protein